MNCSKYLRQAHGRDLPIKLVEPRVIMIVDLQDYTSASNGSTE
jgi:hypothetical protein